MDLKTRLSAIYFLDVLSFALIMSSIIPYIISLGGKHTVLGIFGAGGAVLQLLSGPFLKSLIERRNKLNVLNWCSRAGFILNLCLILEQSYWMLILNRLIYAFLNQSQLISRNLLVENKQENLDKLLPILHTSAFIVGPIASGYFFNYRTFIFVLASLLQLTNILTVASIKMDKKKAEKSAPPPPYFEEVARKIQHGLSESFSACKNCNLKDNSNVLLFKILMVANMSVYFTKFPMLLIYNYRSSPLAIGSTAAHQAVFLFISGLSLPFLKKNFNEKDYLIEMIGVFLVGLFGCCYSPHHEWHLLFIIPMALGKVFLDDSINLLAAAKKDSLTQNCVNCFCNLTRIFVPLICGVLCDLFGPGMIKILSIVPILAIFYLLYSQETCSDEKKSKTESPKNKKKVEDKKKD